MPAPALDATATTAEAAAARQTTTAELGSRGLRFLALLIDSAVILFPVLLIAAMTQSHAVGGVLYILATLLYAPLLLARPGADNGQTIGKQTLGLRVVCLADQNAPLTLHQSCLRELVGRTLLNVCTLGLYAFFDSVWCLFDPNKQTLHDKIADTIVVKDTAKRDPSTTPTFPSAP